ncbi:MAG: hypothetical protein QXV17_08730 [Candidatus Micrarchaeaceae archaeon]
MARKPSPVKLTRRTVNLNEHIDNMLKQVAPHMFMTENELIRYILTKELEKMVSKINKIIKEESKDE